MVFAQNKRSFSDDESCPIASKKHVGQSGYHGKVPTSVVISPCSNLPHKLSDSGHRPLKCQDSEILIHTIKESNFLVDGECRYDNPPDLVGVSPKEIYGGIFSLSDASSFSSEEITGSDSPTDEAVCDMQDHYSRGALAHFDEPLFPVDHYYRKHVAIGPSHQAHVPSLELQCSSSLYSKGSPANSVIDHASPCSVPRTIIVDDEDDNRRIGSCIIQMPVMESDFDSVRTVGYGRINCKCPDQRSMRCVRQHIAEEREKLKSLLGPCILIDLGFDKMGEEVSESWSMEEEHLFQEVVYLNPVSLGKNFWNALYLAFPARSKKELVSYYFNVFVLRRRALQNRWVACDVADSDNDEWQGSAYDELAVSEEDDDSLVESEEFDEDGHPVDDHVFENEDDDIEEEEDDENELEDEQEVVHEDVFEEPDTHKSFTKYADISCGSGPGLLLDSMDNQDVHDVSCMSFECYPNHCGLHNSMDTSLMHCSGTVSKAQIEGDKDWSTSHVYESSDGMFADSFLLEQTCDSKVWDMNFLPVSKKDVDILPTYCMIEEVFGDETWHKEPPIRHFPCN